MVSYKYSFEKLDVWNEARDLVKAIYRTTENFPDKEKFGLNSQIQKAVISIVSNIAEGVSRNSIKEQMRFIEIAYGSLMEVYCQLYVAVDLEYMTAESFETIKQQIDKIANKLNALNRSLLERLNN